jgi:hypothetical protein
VVSSARSFALAFPPAFALLVLAGGLLGAAGEVGCKRTPMASPAQCEKLLDRYIDLKLSEDPRARTMTSEARANLRGTIATDVLSDSDVQQVKTQCETEVTEREYTCAIAAPTSRAWNDCIE